MCLILVIIIWLIVLAISGPGVDGGASSDPVPTGSEQVTARGNGPAAAPAGGSPSTTGGGVPTGEARTATTRLRIIDRFGLSPADLFDEILDPLIDYTKVHFSSEQLLMRLYQYPRYQEHVECLENLRRVYLVGSTAVARVAADQLSDWIFAHIRGAGRALGHFLVRLGVGPG